MTGNPGKIVSRRAAKKHRYVIEADHLMRIDPDLARVNDLAISLGLNAVRFRAWSRKDGGVTVRAVWRSRVRSAVAVTMDYVGRYQLDGALLQPGTFALAIGGGSRP